MTKTMKSDTIKIAKHWNLVVYYDKASRSWFGFYTDNTGHQIGDAWSAPTRDEILIFRPTIWNE